MKLEKSLLRVYLSSENHVKAFQMLGYQADLHSKSNRLWVYLDGCTLLCKLCICSHKYAKQTFDSHAGNLFSLVGGSRSQTSFRRLASAATCRFGTFLSFTFFCVSRATIFNTAKIFVPAVLDAVPNLKRNINSNNARHCHA